MKLTTKDTGLGVIKTKRQNFTYKTFTGSYRDLKKHRKAKTHTATKAHTATVSETLVTQEYDDRAWGIANLEELLTYIENELTSAKASGAFVFAEKGLFALLGARGGLRRFADHEGYHRLVRNRATRLRVKEGEKPEAAHARAQIEIAKHEAEMCLLRGIRIGQGYTLARLIAQGRGREAKRSITMKTRSRKRKREEAAAEYTADRAHEVAKAVVARMKAADQGVSDAKEDVGLRYVRGRDKVNGPKPGTGRQYVNRLLRKHGIKIGRDGTTSSG